MITSHLTKLHLCIVFLNFFISILIESCVLNYCQDGIEVDHQCDASDCDKIDHVKIYGHYELQPDDVNGRPYFRWDTLGIFWDGIDKWWIGDDSSKGQPIGLAYYEKDAFCPHQLTESNWQVLDEGTWQMAVNRLVISCKYIFCKAYSK